MIYSILKLKLSSFFQYILLVLFNFIFEINCKCTNFNVGLKLKLNCYFFKLLFSFAFNPIIGCPRGFTL